MASILIIDDESNLVRSLTFALEDEGHAVHGAGTAADGLAKAAELQPDLILLDLKLPDMSGLDVLETLKARQIEAQVIMISAHGDTRSAVKAVKLGAADYITKPFDLDDLSMTIHATLERRQMAAELEFHRGATIQESGMLGASLAMRDLLGTVERIAASAAMRILVLGESGTGKALVARTVHSASPRASGPFIEINCASLPEQLIEAELFGAEKGAYTGAHQRRVGLVALADKGTLFLDEIGELPLPLQAKLLHFLENGQYRPIGSGRAQTSDVRVVAATNRDLAAAARAGTFREDLYFRLNVIQLNIPPLRERASDVPALIEHFSRLFAREERSKPITVSEDARQALMQYRWPGNVRELKNLIERLTILYPGTEIGAETLPRELVDAEAPLTATAPIHASQGAANIEDALASTEREMMLAALRDAGGHKGQAAERLGISRHAFKRRLQRLGLG
ncbi:sigma-54 dependent transcriptional regulator [Noviherbaspirillum sp. UKPF54]|uniref:sigma-54-dependent transcriptional regulator n=1 Tax=Noviherbaspirillum sp. UKPF54 TaxID=2601898 RepID=UPI0011B15948|nr:sigma-54 dependent transcriptional regulator [Noviherbaspirillum sp. UKPF54]QDZ27527.1 sigma-54-dependent Fis family transcriptional regulator [Noviherbaspirillum sp. UKPF54]